MIDSLYIAATGMHAQQQNVDSVANNLANVNTVGFKKSRVSFVDLVAQGARKQLTEGAAAAFDASNAVATASLGVGVASVSKLFDAGDVKKTDGMYDVAISGDGFLEVMLPDGSSAYTRGGSLKVGSDGLLATQAGHALKPALTIPEGALSVTIENDGKVFAKTADSATPLAVGRLEMVRFANPIGLQALGDNEYRATAASGDAIAGRAGEESMGTIRQGYLEGSNVKLVEEMVNLMVAQRAYEASVKVAQASDEMLGMVNSLRR